MVPLIQTFKTESQDFLHCVRAMKLEIFSIWMKLGYSFRTPLGLPTSKKERIVPAVTGQKTVWQLHFVQVSRVSHLTIFFVINAKRIMWQSRDLVFQHGSLHYWSWKIELDFVILTCFEEFGKFFYGDFHSFAGEKIRPLVIRKSKKPRCFNNVEINSLPVLYPGPEQTKRRGRPVLSMKNG